MEAAPYAAQITKMLKDVDSEVALNAASALGHMDPPTAQEHVDDLAMWLRIGKIDFSDPRIILGTLGGMFIPVCEALAMHLENPVAAVRRRAARRLGLLGE